MTAQRRTHVAFWVAFGASLGGLLASIALMALGSRQGHVAGLYVSAGFGLTALLVVWLGAWER